MIQSDAAKAQRLASAAPANTSNATLFTATLITEITRLHVCNLTGGAATFRLWHVPAGGAVADQYALIYDFSMAANDWLAQENFNVGTGLVLEPGDFLVIRSGTAGALAFNLYGLTPEVSPRAD